MDSTKVTKPLRRLLKLPYCGAVIVAAGNASRMGGVDKILAPLGGIPVILRTVQAFQECDAVKEIVIVTRQDLIAPIMDLCKDIPKLTAVVLGGADRQASVVNGLNVLSSKVRLAAIHDGARPLVTWQLIDATVRAARAYGAAAPAIPVKDTVKVVQGGLVQHTPDRSTLRAVQTPQVFDIDLLRGALEKAAKEELTLTDDCSAVEAMGFSVKLVEGLERNLKITTPPDLRLAEIYLEEEK